MSFSLVLGAGGARGFGLVGFAQVLVREGLHPTAIAGASIGSLVGAAVAAGRIDELADWAADLNLARYISLLDLRPLRGGIVGGSVINTVIDHLGLPEKIEDLPIPFACNACDLETGETLTFTSGPLFEAVRASMALPGVLPPLKHQGRWLVDGGITNPVPTDLVLGLSDAPVIAVTPSDGPSFTYDEKAPSYPQVLQASTEMMLQEIRRARNETNPASLFLNVGLNHMTVLDFHKAPKAMEKGRALAEARLDEIKQVVGLG